MKFKIHSHEEFMKKSIESIKSHNKMESPINQLISICE